MVSTAGAAGWATPAVGASAIAHINMIVSTPVTLIVPCLPESRKKGGGKRGAPPP